MEQKQIEQMFVEQQKQLRDLIEYIRIINQRSEETLGKVEKLVETLIPSYEL